MTVDQSRAAPPQVSPIECDRVEPECAIPKCLEGFHHSLPFSSLQHQQHINEVTVHGWIPKEGEDTTVQIDLEGADKPSNLAPFIESIHDLNMSAQLQVQQANQSLTSIEARVGSDRTAGPNAQVSVLSLPASSSDEFRTASLGVNYPIDPSRHMDDYLGDLWRQISPMDDETFLAWLQDDVSWQSLGLSPIFQSLIESTEQAQNQSARESVPAEMNKELNEGDNDVDRS